MRWITNRHAPFASQPSRAFRARRLTRHPGDARRARTLLIFIFSFLFSPFTSSARARARWSTSAPAKTCTAVFAISGGQHGGEGASRERLGRGRRRAGSSRSVARARDARRAAGASAPDACSGGVASARGESRRARGKAEGRRAARVSARGRASARTHSALHLVLGPVPVRLRGLVPVFLPAGEGRDEADARGSATTACGATGVAREGKTEGGVRWRTPPHGPIAGRVTDFAARTLPRTSPWFPPCAPRSPPVASRDPPSCSRGTE